MRRIIAALVAVLTALAALVAAEAVAPVAPTPPDAAGSGDIAKIERKLASLRANAGSKYIRE